MPKPTKGDGLSAIRCPHCKHQVFTILGERHEAHPCCTYWCQQRREERCPACVISLARRGFAVR